MSNEQPLVKAWNPKYRKRKSHDGVGWAPASIGDVATGIYCKPCKTRHGYNGAGKMRIGFEKFGETFQIIWYCPKTGEQMAETTLGLTEQKEEEGETDA